MNPENPIYIWPEADTFTMLMAILVLVGLFMTAVLMEWWRRQRDRRARLKAEWVVTRQIAHERELSEGEWKLLESLIRRFMPRSPHQAVTVKQVFDQIVDRELGEVERANDEELLTRQALILRDIRNRLGLTFIPLGKRIQNTRELYLEQTLWCGTDHEKSDWYRAQTLNVDEAFFHVVPASMQRVPPFKAGDVVTFRMWREEDARYEFRARLARVESQPLAFVFRHTTEMERLQAREHFRLTYDQPADVAIVSAPLNGDMTNVERRPVVTRLRGRITSLSAGGIAVLVHQPVPRQVLFRVRIDLEDGDSLLELTARLVEALPLSSGQYLLRGAFVGMNEEAAESISHHVFRKQQQQMSPAETIPPKAAN